MDAGLVIILIVVVLAIIGIALWLRSRRKGGVIAAPPGKGRSSRRPGPGGGA